MTSERRKHRRVKVSQPVSLLRRDGVLLVDCMLRDISVGGARLEFDAIPELPKVLSLRVPRGGRVHRQCEIVWQSDTEMGVRFVAAEPCPPAPDAATAESEALYV